jgi:hypothetical protein
MPITPVYSECEDEDCQFRVIDRALSQITNPNTGESVFWGIWDYEGYEDDDQLIAHGEVHTYLKDFGWCTPSKVCACCYYGIDDQIIESLREKAEDVANTYCPRERSSLKIALGFSIDYGIDGEVWCGIWDGTAKVGEVES